MQRALIIATVLLLVSSIVPLNEIGESGIASTLYPSMYVKSPASYNETIYQISPSLIQVYAYTNISSPVQCIDIFYSIDNSPNKTLSLSKMPSLQEITVVNYAYGPLDNLTFGYHTITAYSAFTNGETLSKSVTLFVNVTSNNALVLIYPQNTTYNSTEVPITCIVDNQLTIEYNLDEVGYLPSDRNLTLTGLFEGQHRLTVKAVSDYGTYSEQTVNFNVVRQNDNLVVSVLVIPVVTAIGIILAIILLRKRQASK